MAVGRIADYASQIPKIWAEDLFAQAENLTFWGQFEGPEGSGMPIIRKNDLEKAAGDTIHTDMILALTGAGSTGDTTLTEGNEEKMKYRQMDVVVNALKHGVRWSDLSQILMTHNMRKNALGQLSKWLAGKLDNEAFTALAASTLPTINKWFAGTATTRNTVADSDAGGRLTLTDISAAKAYAQSNLLMEPLRLEGGEEYFGLVLHPYANLALKNSTAYQQAERDAGIRGRDNPLFTGATAVWDGVIIYTSNRVPLSNNTNSPVVAVADNIFFGAQAGSRAYAYYPRWTEQAFSYEEELGVATFVVEGFAANVFDLSAAGDGSASTGIGSLILYSSAVTPTA